MATHTVIEGNAFYEIDDECMKKRSDRETEKENRSEKKDSFEYQKKEN
ncbi:MAG: hypothetical protein LUH07_01875 [Lachnospiraceae bacterium]|nr:hypothetical protein [Lachnospiraceae bacterium]